MAIGPDYSVRPYADKYARDETPVSESDLRSIQKMADNVDSKKWGIDTRYSISSSMRLMDEVIKDTLGRQDNVENQFQDVLDETTGKDVINGPEIIAARNGEANLKTRIDKDHQEVTAQLADIVTIKPSGSDDTQFIQNKVNNGGNVIFSEKGKVYKISSAITLPSDITIDGNGSKIICSTSTAFQAFGKNNITIKNIEIEGPGALTIIPTDPADGGVNLGDVNPSNGCYDINIVNCTIYGFHTGIGIRYGKRVRVENNHIYDYGTYGVMLSRTQSFFCDNNEIHDTLVKGTTTGVYCISATGGSVHGDPQKHCSITNNKLYNNEPWSAIMSHDISDLTIANNHIYNVRNGIDLGTREESDTRNIVITGNVITGTETDSWKGEIAGNCGIAIASEPSVVTPRAFDITISGNTIRNFGKFQSGGAPNGAIRLSAIDGCNITGNTIEQPDGVAQYLGGIFIGYYCFRVNITGNYVRTESKTPVYVANNIGESINISGNTLYSATSTYAVRVENCTIDGLYVNNLCNKDLSGYVEIGTNVIDGVSHTAPYGGRGISKHLSQRVIGNDITDLAVGSTTTLAQATMPGIEKGDTVAVGYYSQSPGIIVYGYGIGSNTVRVEIYNGTTSPLTLSATPVSINAFKHN